MEAPSGVSIIRRGDLEIDILHLRARVDDRDLRLTSLEVRLLFLLAANAGRALTRDEILNHLWGVDFAAGSNVVDRHVHSLRAKLHDDWRRPRFIATVPGQGYRFVSGPGAHTRAVLPPAPSAGTPGRNSPGPRDGDANSTR